MAIGLANPAAAQCVSTVVNGATSTLCTGTVINGLSVTTTQQRVTIAKDARLMSGTNTAALLNTGNFSTVTVNGTVDGGAKPGVLVQGGDLVYIPYDPYAGAAVPSWPWPAPGTLVPSYTNVTTSLTVGAGATVTGSTGVQLTKTNGASFGNGVVSASIDNAGTITASSGPAVVASQGASFNGITNRQSGLIGGIAGPFSFVSNQGNIDGGSATAVDGSSVNTGFTITNSGTIRSAGNTGSIVAGASFVTVTNSGTIRNAGNGMAITGGSSLTVTNQTGGVIASGGGVALRSNGALTLNNSGTIEGSVIAAGDSLTRNFVSTTAGTIKGDLLFGAGADTLNARFDAAAGRIESVTGRIDLGAGDNTLGLSVNASATLTRAALPANFTHLTLAVESDAVVTLGSDFASLQDLGGSGRGRIVNNAAITIGTVPYTAAILTNGITDASGAGGLDVENRAAILSSAQFANAVIVNSGSLINSGSIVSTANTAVAMTSYSGGQNSPVRTLTNSGTVRGAVSGASLSNVDLVNSGSIIGTIGSGASISGFGLNSGPGSSNSGTIRGATTGLTIQSARIANSGTITGGATGILASYGALIDNLAGGTIGGAVGVDGRNSGNIQIRNAGTINGSVRFDGAFSYGSSVFIDNGGMVNGDLTFGGGNDLLVVRLDASSSRPLGGVTGTVDGGSGTDTLRYVASADGTATVAGRNGFEQVSYEVTGGARLTLADGNWGRTLGLLGAGSIDVATNISVARGTVLDLTGTTTDMLLTGTTGVAQGSNAGLTVISRGTLTSRLLTYDFATGGGLCAVSAGAANFQNLGTITAVTSINGFGGSAICGGTTVTNNGTIQFSGVGAIVSGPQTLINTGLITDRPGSGAIGAYAQTLINSGTILTDSNVYTGGYPGTASVTNSGRLESRKAEAVVLGSAGDVLVNERVGVIKSPTTAILGFGATITNRGTIEGDVLLGSDGEGTVANRFVSDGGTVAGSLLFDAGNDVFVQTSAATGISGRIDGGAGIDTVLLAGSGTGTFSGATNFERLQVQSGSWTLATPANFSLGTTVAAGATLTGTTSTLLGTIDDAGTLQIAQDVDGRFQATLRGTGTLAKSGTGTVTLGAQPGFTGTVQVLGGGVSFDGNATFALSINNGSFAGTGQIGALSLGAGGVVSPGGSGGASALAIAPTAGALATPANVGTLTVAGNFAQGAGSTYLATIAADGLSDRIIVGGTATIASGARLQLVGSRAGIGTRYTLLTAAGGIRGAYGMVEQSAGDTELRLAYATNSLFADVVRSRSGLVRVAATGNQQGTATGLGSLGVANAAYAAVTTLADDGATRSGLDQLSGQAHASLRAANVQDAQLVEAALRGHLRDPLAGHGLWGSYISGSGTNDGSVEAARAHRSTLGGVGGIEQALGTLRLSVGGGFTRTRLSAFGLSRQAESKTVHVFGTAGAQLGPIGLSGGIGYGWTRNRVDRQVAVAGFRDALRAAYRGTIAHGFAEAQHAVPLGGGSVTPFVGIEAYRQRVNGFGETGGAAALAGAARTEHYAFTRAGVRLETPVVATLSVRADGAWVRRIEGRAPEAMLRFAGGDAFAVRGTPLSRDAATAELAAVWAPARTMRISAGYVGTIGSRSNDNGFRLTAMLGF